MTDVQAPEGAPSANASENAQVERPTADTKDVQIGSGAPRRATKGALPTGPAATLAAALSAAAGVMHIAMVPVHAGSSVTEALLFAAAGWAQLAIAVGLLLRPNVTLLRAGVVASIVFVAAWAVSRTVGLPFGSHAGDPEPVAFIDATVVGLEALYVVVAAAWALRPTLGAGRGSAFRPVAFGAALAAVALATGAIAAPSAADHGGAGHHGETAAADGHAHDAGAAPAAAGGHDHGTGAAPAADDKGFSLMSNGHQHDAEPAPLDPATQAELDRQLALTRALVHNYPTVKEAEAAGWKRSGPFAPGLGTHFTGPEMRLPGASPITDEQIQRPILIYYGHQPDSPLVGFMYLAAGVGDAPAGFVGDHDIWHWHDNVCIKTREDGSIDTPFGADAKVTKPLCDKVGGQWIGNTGYMAHVWNVPGWENPDGMFAELNPKLMCKDGTYYIIPVEKVGSNTTACKDEAIPQDL